MSNVLHILVALFALALPGLGWGTHMELPWLLPLLCLVPHALAWRVRNRLLFARYRAAAATDRLLNWSPVLLHVFAVTVLGWTRSVESWWGFETGLTQWPGPGLLLGLLPFVVLRLVAIDARVRSIDPRPDRRRELRTFHGRMFLSALLPFVLFLSISMVVSFDEAWRVHIEEVALYNALFLGGMIAVFAVTAPFFLTKVWETAPLEKGWMRQLLEGIARRAGFRCRELLVWRTGNNMANAAIVGFTPRTRVVLFTDALLAQLGPRELAAVFAHEIGHARGRHPVIFAGFALLLFLGSDLLIAHLPLESEAQSLGVFFGVLLLWLLGFGYLSRRFELEADLAAVELLGDGRALLDALARIGGGASDRKSTWRHFGRARRTQFLERAERDPDTGRRLRRSLRAWTFVGGVVLFVVLVLQVVALAGSFASDLVVADLRLGRFSAAAERIADGVAVGEDVKRLVARGAALGPEERSPAALEALARASFARGEARATLDLLDLATLRGERGLEGVRAAIGALVGDAEEGIPPRALSPGEIAGLPPPWAPLFASAGAGAGS